jgi:hypothetical protein
MKNGGVKKMLIIKGYKEKTHKCVICGESKLNIHYVDMVGHVCEDCTNKEEDYNARNTKIVQAKKVIKDNITFSFEFETSENHPNCLILGKYGFIPTHDSSINGHEWKSPIFPTLTGVPQMLKNFDKLKLKDFTDSDCGTHIHVGTLDDAMKHKIIEQRNVLFNPLVSVIKNDPSTTEKFWGRQPNSYCRTSITDDRYSMFNTNTGSRKPTLEFRLPKFQNAEQFYRCIKFATNTTGTIVRGYKEAEEKGMLTEEATLDISKKILTTYRRFLKEIA